MKTSLLLGMLLAVVLFATGCTDIPPGGPNGQFLEPATQAETDAPAQPIEIAGYEITDRIAIQTGLALLTLAALVVVGLLVFRYISKKVNAKPKEGQKSPTLRSLDDRFRELERVNEQVPAQLRSVEQRAELLVGALNELFRLANGLKELAEKHQVVRQMIRSGKVDDFDLLAEIVGSMKARDRITAARLDKPWLWPAWFKEKMLWNLSELAGHLYEEAKVLEDYASTLDDLIQAFTHAHYQSLSAQQVSISEVPALKLRQAAERVERTLVEALMILQAQRHKSTPTNIVQRVTAGAKGILAPNNVKTLGESEVINLGDLGLKSERGEPLTVEVEHQEENITQ